MRKRIGGGLALILCLGLAALPGQAQRPAATGDDLTTQGAVDPYYRAWAGRSAAYRLAQQKQLQVEREAREKEEKANASGGGGTKSPPTKSIAEQRAREQNALFRRIEICDRLRQLAVQSNDTALLREVDRLESQAFELYQKRTGLAGTKLVLEPLKADVEKLDAQLGPKSPAVDVQKLDAQLRAKSPSVDVQKLNAQIGPKSSETGMILPMPPVIERTPRVATRKESKP